MAGTTLTDEAGGVRSAAGQARAVPSMHTVDERLPLGKLVVLALQHVLAMYAGAVTVPLVVASALHLPTHETAYLISSDLLACGIITILQCVGFGFVGVRLPVMMGVTFVAVGPAITIASNPGLGLPGVFGASLISGLLGIFLAPLFGRFAWVFSPVVTGTTILLIGISLMGVAVTWITGGVSGAAGEVSGIAVAGGVLATILLVVRFGRGFVANTAVLIGLVVGFAVTCALGWVNFSPMTTAGWFMVVSPLHFGRPRFDLLSTLSMTVVMLITMVESSGMLFALGEIVERPLTAKDLTRGLRADAVGAMLGGFFNSLPYTSYAQNVALVGMTGVRSRYVCTAAGVMLMLLATVPKLSYLVTALPAPVLGGAALVIFGMVAASGVETLGKVDFASSRKNLYIVALGLSVGLIPTANPHFFDKLPKVAAGFLHNGVMLGIGMAVVLNLALSGVPKKPAARGTVTS